MVRRKLPSAGRVGVHAATSGCARAESGPCAAIQLFVRRASAVRRRFDITLGVCHAALLVAKKKTHQFGPAGLAGDGRGDNTNCPLKYRGMKYRRRRYIRTLSIINVRRFIQV